MGPKQLFMKQGMANITSQGAYQFGFGPEWFLKVCKQKTTEKPSKKSHFCFEIKKERKEKKIKATIRITVYRVPNLICRKAKSMF
jgi:hypothetical protein